MLVIRLKRIGKKKKPFYRIVVASKKTSVKGKYLEMLGFYNPLLKDNNIKIKKERVKFWIEKGAKTSDTVNNLLVQAGYYPKSKNIKKTVGKKKKKKKEEKPEKPAEISIPKAQQKAEGGLLEQSKEEIQAERSEAPTDVGEEKAKKEEKTDIAEQIEKVKTEEKIESKFQTDNS